MKTGELESYYEPFLGSGAVFFFIAQNYPIKKAYLSDINEELILTFNVVKNDVDRGLKKLFELKEEYYSLSVPKRELYFYKIRQLYNETKSKINLKNTQTNGLKGCTNDFLKQNMF